MTTMITWGEESAQKWGRVQQGRQRVAKVQQWDNLDIFYQQHRQPSRHRIETRKHVLGVLSNTILRIVPAGGTHYPPHPPFAENKIKVLRRNRFYDKKINPWQWFWKTVLVLNYLWLVKESDLQEGRTAVMLFCLPLRSPKKYWFGLVSPSCIQREPEKC